MIKNALAMVSLPGEMGKAQREEVNQVIDGSGGTHNFVILFKGVLGRTDYRALYRFEETEGHAVKVHGMSTAPETISADMVD